MIEILHYKKIADIDMPYVVDVCVDEFYIISYPLTIVQCEVNSKWNEAKTQATFDVLHDDILDECQNRIERKGLIIFNRTTNNIEFTFQTKQDTEIDAMKQRLTDLEKYNNTR